MEQLCHRELQSTVNLFQLSEKTLLMVQQVLKQLSLPLSLMMVFQAEDTEPISSKLTTKSLEDGQELTENMDQ